MSRFSSIEWNTMVNRARAALEAQRQCRHQPGHAAACRHCPLAGGSGTQGAAGLPCERAYRSAERHLRAMARHAPEAQQYQLCRTVDTLELTYRQLRASREEVA